MNPRVISVRRMGADDEEVVKALAGRAFSPLVSLSFPRSPDALIAERGGELLGSVVLTAACVMVDPKRNCLA